MLIFDKNYLKKGRMCKIRVPVRWTSVLLAVSCDSFRLQSIRRCVRYAKDYWSETREMPECSLLSDVNTFFWGIVQECGKPRRFNRSGAAILSFLTSVFCGHLVLDNHKYSLVYTLHNFWCHLPRPLILWHFSINRRLIF